VTARAPLRHPFSSLSGGAAASLLLLLAAACGGSDAGAPAADVGPLPPGLSALAAEAAIPVPPVADARCATPSDRRVVRAQIEWDAFWASMPGCPAPRLPAGFDFQREMLVFVSPGPRRPPVEGVSIAASGVVRDTLLVFAELTVPREGCTTATQEPYARALARLPAGDRPVRFVQADRLRDC